MTACDLTISVPKTKILVAGSSVVQSDLDPIIVGDCSITSVTSFYYLGSLVESHGGVQLELNTRISRTACVFGALRESVIVMLYVLSGYKVHNLPSCDTDCSVICCGNLACETKGGMHFSTIVV